MPQTPRDCSLLVSQAELSGKGVLIPVGGNITGGVWENGGMKGGKTGLE